MPNRFLSIGGAGGDDMKRGCMITRPVAPVLFLFFAAAVYAQPTAFNFQGRLIEGGNPANGQYDMIFRLFDTTTVGTGTQFGNDFAVPAVQVTSGTFNTQIDFGPGAFTGAPRFLEISVKPTSSPDPYGI